MFGTQEPLFPMSHSIGDGVGHTPEDPEIEDSIGDMAQRYKDAVRSDVIQGPKIEGKVEKEAFIMIWMFGLYSWYLDINQRNFQEMSPEVIGNDKSRWGETATLAIQEVWWCNNQRFRSSFPWFGLSSCLSLHGLCNSLPHQLQQWNISEGYLTLRPKNLDLVGWNAWNAWKRSLTSHLWV